MKGNGSGRITRADIEAKLKAIRDDIEPVGEQAKGGLMALDRRPVIAEECTRYLGLAGEGAPVLSLVK